MRRTPRKDEPFSAATYGSSIFAGLSFIFGISAARIALVPHFGAVPWRSRRGEGEFAWDRGSSGEVIVKSCMYFVSAMCYPLQVYGQVNDKMFLISADARDGHSSSSGGGGGVVVGEGGRHALSSFENSINFDRVKN